MSDSVPRFRIRFHAISVEFTGLPQPKVPVNVEFVVNEQAGTLQKVRIPKGKPLLWQTFQPIEVHYGSVINVRVYWEHRFISRVKSSRTFTFHAAELLAESVSGLAAHIDMTMDGVELSVAIKPADTGVPNAQTIEPANRAAVEALQARKRIIARVDTVRNVLQAILNIAGRSPELNSAANSTLISIDRVWKEFARHINFDSSLTGAVDGLGGLMTSTVHNMGGLMSGSDVLRLQVRMDSEESQSAIVRILLLMKEVFDLVGDYTKNRITVKSRDQKSQMLDFMWQFNKLNDQLESCLPQLLEGASKGRERELSGMLLPARNAVNSAYRGKCLEGTRLSITDEIRAWANNEGSTRKRVFWLSGPQGTGKSAIASSVVDFLEADSAFIVASFFCERNTADLRDWKKIITTILFQLAIKFDTFGRALVTKLRENPGLCMTNFRTPNMQDFVPAVIEILKKSRPPKPVVVVLDALDELGCGTKVHARAQERTMHFLSMISVAVGWLRVFVTSQPYRDFDRWDKDMEVHCELHSLNVNDYENLQDISIYSQHCLDALVEETQMQRPHHGEIVKFASQARGLFAWTHIACRYFHNMPDRDNRFAFLISKSTSTAENLDAQTALSSLYTDILDGCVECTGVSAATVRDLLEVTASVRQPLRASDLITLASYENGESEMDYRNALNWLQSVILTERDGRIQILHSSLIDFLEDEDGAAGQYRVLRDAVEAKIARACLRIMTSKAGLKFNICGLETSFSFNDTIEDLARRIEDGISGILQYCCVCWADHLFAISPHSSPRPGTRDCQEINDLLDQFLSNPSLLFWIEALSLMGRLQSALSSLAMFNEHPQVVHNEDNRALAIDAVHFLRTFYEPISKCTPHLYLSALPFAPSESRISKLFSRHFPNSVSLEGDRAISWPPLTIRAVGHASSVYSVAFSPDGRFVASGCMDGTVRIWDTKVGSPVGEPLVGHTTTVNSVVYSPDGHHIASGSSDGTVRIWDVFTGHPVGEPLQGHTSSVSSVAFSPDGRFLASGSWDSTSRLWDVSTGSPVGEPLKGHVSPITSVTFSPDGQFVATSSGDSFRMGVDVTIRIWDVKTGKPVGEPLRGHTSSVNSISFRPDERRIASGSDDGTVRIWDIHTGILIGEPLRGHTSAVNSVSFSPDGRYIVSGSSDKTMRIWDAKTGVPVGGPLKGHTLSVSSVAFSPDGETVAAGSLDDTVTIWNVNVCSERLEMHLLSVTSVSFSPDAKYIVSGSDDYTVRVWDARSGMPVGEPLEGHTDSVTSVSFAPDGRHIVSGSRDNTVRVWDVQSGVPVGEPLEGHTGSVTSVSFSPDGRYIVSGSRDKTVRVWDVRSGAPVGEPLQGHSSPVASVSFSPDGQYIVSGSYDKTVRVWDASAGAPIGEPLEGHTGSVTTVSFSPDGKHIASGSYDETVRIWDARSGALVGKPLQGHFSSVTSVSFSPDGQHVVSGSCDNTVRVWDAHAGGPVGTPLIGHTAWVNSVAFSPDGRYIVSGSSDCTICVWHTPTDALIHDDEHSRLDGFLAPLVREQWRAVNRDGWVRLPGEDKGVLLWVPPSHRFALRSDFVLSIPPANPYSKIHIDTSRFVYGDEWPKVSFLATELTPLS